MIDMTNEKEKAISSVEYKKLERFLRKILEKIHVKRVFYKMLIIPSQEIALHRLRKIVNSSPSIEKNYGNKKIIFNSLNARYMKHTYTEGAIAKSLQIRGHNPKMLICGGALNMCTAHHTIDTPYEPWSCKNCIYFSKKFYEITGLDYSTYFDYFDKGKLEKINKKIDNMSIEECKKYIYNGVKVGFHATTSAQRYFKGDVPDESYFNKILRLELINAIISTDVAEGVMKKEKPDVLVSSHGCYSSWGSFSEYFINHGGVRTCFYMPGEKNTLTFDRHKSDDYFNKYIEESRKKRPLDKKERKELDNFLKKRIKGKEGQVAHYGFTDTKKETLEEEFNFNKYNKTYIMFPNVPWDAALTGADIGFNDVFNWIFTTIELFKNKSNFQLIVKIHPSEITVMESKRTVLEYISDKFRTLPDNIKIIPSNTKISPYSLFPFIDIGLVYNGTIGLEMSIQGIPVIVSGNAHYGKKGFTYDISTKEEYSNVLLKGISTLPNQQNLAKIYAYFHFIKKFIPNLFFYYNSFLNLGWKIDSLEEFSAGKDKYLDHICNYIVNDGVFQDW
jgi:hypothetical protein